MTWGNNNNWDMKVLIEQANNEGLEIIPENTLSYAAIHDIETKQYSDDEPEIFRVTWKVKGGKFSNRFVYQNIKINDLEEEKKKKAFGMFARICMICNIEFPETLPTKHFFMNLFGIPCGIRIMEYHMPETNNHGNWVSCVYSIDEVDILMEKQRNDPLLPNVHEQLDAMAALTKKAASPTMDVDDDIPF